VSVPLTVLKATPTVSVVPFRVTYDGRPTHHGEVYWVVGGSTLAQPSHLTAAAPRRCVSYTVTVSFAGTATISCDRHARLPSPCRAVVISWRRLTSRRCHGLRGQASQLTLSATRGMLPCRPQV